MFGSCFEQNQIGNFGYFFLVCNFFDGLNELPIFVYDAIFLF